MQVHRTRLLTVAAVSFAVCATSAQAQSTPDAALPPGFRGAPPTAFAPDGVPAGMALPPAAQRGSTTYEFGSCGTRDHAAGGWVCVDDQPLAAASSRKPVKAHAAGWFHTRFLKTLYPKFGIGETTIGQIKWTRRGTFYGLRMNTNQSTEVWQYGPPVRYRWQEDKWRVTSYGAQYRDSSPGPGSETSTFTRSLRNQPVWKHLHSPGYQFYVLYYFNIRASGIYNPSSSDGWFYSPIESSRTYSCGISESGCYFPFA